MTKRAERVTTRVKGPGAPVKEEVSKDEVGTAVRERPPLPHLARHYARKRFARALPMICDTYAEAAIAGDIPSLKALIALAGFDREDAHAPARTRRRKSIATMLLEDLRNNPSPAPAPKPGDWVDE